MKVYSPSDMATMLEIKPATLRKYSALLEANGYHINRNSQNHRYYQDKDIITIRNVIRGVNGDVTLERSVQNVIKLQSSGELTNDTDSAQLANSSDMNNVKAMIRNQGEMIAKQNDLIKGLIERLDEQQMYIDQSIHERDMKLLQSIDKIMQDKKEIATSEEKKASKKGFFAKLFDR